MRAKTVRPYGARVCASKLRDDVGIVPYDAGVTPSMRGTPGTASPT
ncbi:MAG: hypothetical protein FWE47_03845 [Oscillospiraceae bacterium]|nr:hypothetical protein [Oscillospiraceae bacterium]